MQLFLKIFLIFGLNHLCLSQNLIKSDIVAGGIVLGSYSQGINFQYSNCSISVDLSQALQIKKASLFFNSDKNYQFNSLNFNNFTFIADQVISNYSIQLDPNLNLNVSSHLIDVTSAININQNTYSFNITNQNNLYIGPFVLVIVYENNSSSNTSYLIYNNSSNLNTFENYFFNDFNLITYSVPIAFSIHSNILWDTITDGTHIDINGQNIGLIGGSDNNQNFIGAGVSGDYNYFNSNLTALGDNDENFFMNGTDGLTDLQSQNNLQSGFNLTLITQSNPMKFNDYMLFTLAYSTPCQPQNVTVSNDTLICPNVPLQLNASGGTPNSHSMSGYEWLPQENLSCYDCADPIFTGDSSQLYTVRIWGSDSCSVVRPVMVRVGQKPPTQSITNAPSLCGANSGSVNLTLQEPSAGIQFSIDNGPLQNNGYFNNLTSGNHTLSIHTLEGCSFDTLVTVGSYSTVNAAFTASPTAGAIPLQVNLSNQSSNYTNLEWFVDGTPQGNTLNNYTVNQSGTVEIELVAWQNNPTCSDTVMVSILAFDSLIISIPNVITPNNDGLNDVFSITSNLPINVSYSFTNRWGTVVASGSISNQQGTLVLWYPSAIYSEGNYFYQLQFSSADVAIDQQIEQIGREKQGFLTLVK
jgi:hypothetical protein